MNDQVMACLDDSRFSSAICDYAAWSAQRLAAPLTLLHVLDHRHAQRPPDLSGSVGIGSQDALLAELALLDQQKRKVAMEGGRRLLEAARTRVAHAVDPNAVLRRGDAVIVVDVQRDFCPGGALPVEQGDRVVPVLNRWLRAAAAIATPVYASRDWHPRTHPSFLEFGGTWPPHCVQDTEGAAFHPALALTDTTVVVTKGVRLDRDQYSAFDETGLSIELGRQGITRLWIGGLAQDVCVRATVLDARREGLATMVIADATLPVTRDGGAIANAEMRRAGAEFVVTAI